jgi:hypothetical protein
MDSKQIKKLLQNARRDLRSSDPYRGSMFARWKWGSAKVYGTIALVSNCKAGGYRVTIEIDDAGNTHIVY